LIPASEVDKTEYEHRSEQDYGQHSDRQTFHTIITVQRAADIKPLIVLRVSQHRQSSQIKACALQSWAIR